jgi:hypothetical protein
MFDFGPEVRHMLHSILMIGRMEAIQCKVLQLFNHKVLALLAVIVTMPLVPLISVVFMGGVGPVVRILVVAAAMQQHDVGHIAVAKGKL